MRIILSRLVLPVALFLAWAPAAHAWSWPVQGPVLQAFAYDEARAYDSGQHRGVDIGADAAGESVLAPAVGAVSFAGTVPTSGKCVTIETPDGYSVTLTHLGSILVAKGGAVAEGDVVGTIGPSGTAEFARPYVHLGIRTTSDPNGYLDPLRFLPPPPAAGSAQTDTTPSQPSTSGGSSTTSASTASPSSTTPGSTVRRSRHTTSRRARASRSRSSKSATEGTSVSPSAAVPAASGQRPSERPASHASMPRAGAPRRSRIPHRRVGEPASSWRRPVVEAAAPHQTSSLDAGHEIQPGPEVSPAERPQPQFFGALLPLVCNGAAALVALGAALIVGRRRRGSKTSPLMGAQVLRLRFVTIEGSRERRAA